MPAASLELRQGHLGTALDTASLNSDAGVWYEFYVRCEGADVEVWRREKGTTDAMAKVLETVSATQTVAKGTGTRW